MTQYERIVMLDSDMIVLQNMDELMDVELNPEDPNSGALFAASHACVCNPNKILTYPKNWIPKNCAFTKQASSPEDAQTKGWPSKDSLELNSGLVVVKPCPRIFEEVIAVLQDGERTAKYDFADQSLLSDLYRGKWLALPYIYNALKTLKWHHKPIWRQENVKNVHYILAIKPWNATPGSESSDETFPWWWRANDERIEWEQRQGISDKWQK